MIEPETTPCPICSTASVDPAGHPLCLQARANRVAEGGRRVPLLVLDLDGTVREGKDDPLGKFVNSAADVRVFPEAVEKMLAWRNAGGRIVGVTNQGGVALGHVSHADALAAIDETQRQALGLFDRVAACFHHPDATDPEMARCWCRKPSPGGLVTVATDLAALYGETYPPHLGLFVGDRLEDERCAKLAGFPFLWARPWRAATNDVDVVRGLAT